MRILVDLSETDIQALDSEAKQRGVSRAALIREAVSDYLADKSQDWIDRGFGLWAKHGFTEDGVAYENRLREEWVREWDSEEGKQRGEDHAA